MLVLEWLNVNQKDMPKRSAQDDLILPNKRSKTMPAGNVARVDIKAADHVQMMVVRCPQVLLQLCQEIALMVLGLCFLVILS